MDWKELQNAVASYQSGSGANVDLGQEYIPGLENLTPRERENYKQALTVLSYSSPEAMTRSSNIGQLGVVGMNGDVSEEAYRMGYGKYKHDYDTSFDYWAQDPVNYRANSQPVASKFFNGMAKIVPYAASTYLDNTVGMVMGIANMSEDLFDMQDGFHPLKSFVNTPFAEMMQKVRDWSDKVLPNYRTTEEVEDANHWWRHMNANFWGDTFLKNLGFTLGAALSGLTYVKGAELLQGKLIKNAYKAGLAASVDGDAAAYSAFQKVLQGGKMANPFAAYNTFADISEAYMKMGWKANLLGGIGGAVGESRVEAINASKEHIQAIGANADEDYNLGKQRLLKSIATNPTYYNNGKITDAGKMYYENELKKLQDHYIQTMNVAEKEATSLANTVFALNMPLLTASNIIMFGRMYSGGYGSQIQKAAKGAFGSWKPASTAVEYVTIPGKNAISEGIEELSQKIFSEGAKDVASKRMAMFHDKQYDRNALRLTSGWLMSMLDSAGDVLIDPTSWEEFTVGALTGALGMPSRNGWSGGIIGGIQEANQNIKRSRELTEQMNKRFGNENFKRLYLGIARHTAEELEKDKHAKDGNSFAWHTVDDEQLLNDVILFKDAGMFEDYENYIDSLGRINKSNINEFRQTLDDTDDAELKAKNDDELIKWVQQRVSESKRAIQQYKTFYNAIDFMSFGTTSESAIKELIFTEAQLENFEKRYKEVLDSVWSKIEPTLVNAAKAVDEEGKPTKKAETAQWLLGRHEEIGSIFGAPAGDIHAGTENTNPTEQAKAFAKLDDVYQAKIMKDLEDLGAFVDQSNNGLKQEVEDLQKLIRSRQNFYAKLFDPIDRRSFGERHDEESKKTESVAADIKGEATKNKAQEYYLKLANAKNLNEYAAMMDAIDVLDDDTQKEFDELVDKNPELKKFKDEADKGYSLLKGVIDKVDEYLSNIPESDEDLRPIYEAVQNVTSKLTGDTYKELSKIGEGEDVILHMANKLLSKFAVDSPGYKFALRILNDIVNDNELSSKFGKTPKPQPSPKTEVKNEKEEESDGKKLRESLPKVTDINDTTLNNIARSIFNGFNLSQQDMIELPAIAQDRLNYLTEKIGQERANIQENPTEKDINDKDKRSTLAERSYISRLGKTVRGYALEVLDSNYAKTGIRRPRVYNSDSANATVKWMQDHKVQEFIDSGALNTLVEHYKGDLPIYFIGNPHYQKDNWNNNPFASSDEAANLLLAVDMSKESGNRDLLAKYEEQGLFTEDTLLTVFDNGNEVKYQVIGQVFNPYPGSDAFKELSEEKQKAVMQTKPQANFMWDYAMRGSIKHQYNADKAGLGDAGRWYVAKLHQDNQNDRNVTNVDITKGDRISTTINYILPGRSETKLNETDISKKNLKSSLSDYKKYGGDYYFALPVIENGQIRVITSNNAPSWSNSVTPVLGSVWIATKSANGTYEWSYLRIARTNEIDDNLWKSDSGFFAQIRGALKDILDPVDMSSADAALAIKTKNMARQSLYSLIYFGLGNNVKYEFDGDGNVTVNIAGVDCTTVDEAIKALKDGSFRFQVSKDYITSMDIMNHFVDSGIFFTDKASFLPIASSFGVNYLTNVNAKGEAIPLTSVKSDYKDISFNPGAGNIDRYAANRPSRITDIPVGNVSFDIDEATGAVYRRTSGKDFVVEDRPEVIAQVKVLAELIYESSTNPISLKQMVNGDIKKLNSVYPGNDWVIKDKNELTMLYERKVGDIVVRAIRRGSNGAFMICQDDVWDGLIVNALPIEDVASSSESEDSAPVAIEKPAEQYQYNWARKSDRGYEVSTEGDDRFSAKIARFKDGTIIFGQDVSGRTIESVYQHGVKQGDWTTNNNRKTGAPRSNDIIKGNTPEASYRDGYLPLWQEWARQNPELIEELRRLSEGKVLTDKFVSKDTTVSQARALADILNGKIGKPVSSQQDVEGPPKPAGLMALPDELENTSVTVTEKEKNNNSLEEKIECDEDFSVKFWD